MESVVLVIHLILALGIICLVLLQRSEGGGLGIGGGGGMGGLATPHSTASAMTKATRIFAALFFCTSLLLAILAGTHSRPASLLEQLDGRGVSQTVTFEGDAAPVDLDEPLPPPSVPVSD